MIGCVMNRQPLTSRNARIAVHPKLIGHFVGLDGDATKTRPRSVCFLPEFLSPSRFSSLELTHQCRHVKINFLAHESVLIELEDPD